MIGRLLDRIVERYPTEALEVGEFSCLKANGMRFTVRAYYAKGLGRVSVMQASGFFGLMRMDTLMITPTETELPLYSYDRIYAMGNDTLIVELYDTLTSPFSEKALLSAKEAYAHLPERDPGTHWYDAIKLPSSISKKGKKKQTAELDALALAHLDAFLASAAPTADPVKKAERSAAYVDGLLANGGPSTDVFKKTLGEEKTARLFHEVLFGA